MSNDPMMPVHDHGPAPDDARTDVGTWADALRPAVGSWLLARVVVLAGFGIARYVADHIGTIRDLTASTVHQGLLSWDGAWYLDIATKGYEHLPREALRFFPGIPLAARFVGSAGLGDRVALVAISNVSALVAGMLLYRLVRFEGWGALAATRATWVLAFAPAAFVFVMGYTDATVVALAIGTMYALRKQSWLVAALLALLAGFSRPTGCLLALPALFEVARGLRGVGWRQLVARGAAVVAAPVGMLAFLLWVGDRFGDLMLPFRVQSSSRLRGELTDPIRAVGHAVEGAANGHLSAALHLVSAVVAIALTVVVLRTQPASYAALAVAVVAVGLTSNNLDSTERYALLAFPLVIAVARSVKARQLEWGLFAFLSSCLFGYALLAFLGLLGP